MLQHNTHELIPSHELQVVNLDAIRNFLCKHPDAAVKSVAQGSSDAALHQAVLASGEVREAGPWLSSWPSGWLWLNMWGLAGELHQSAVLASGEVRRVPALPALETVGKRNTSAAFAMQIRNLYRLLLFVPLQVMQVRKSYFVQLAIGRPFHLLSDCRSRRSATCIAYCYLCPCRLCRSASATLFSWQLADPFTSLMTAGHADPQLVSLCCMFMPLQVSQIRKSYFATKLGISTLDPLR